jgi:hypothetical protein
LAGSKQKETGEFASAMRTWYSGTEEQRQAFDDALNNKLLLRKSAEADFQDADDATKRTLAQTVDNEDGTRTMNIGKAALELGSRMGLNVVFAHEAYRNGKDDGEEGQRAETDRAVVGHISTALALIAGYGAGSVGGEFGAEAKKFGEAYWNKDMEAISEILDQYDSSADYLLLKTDRSFQDDGSADLHWEAVNKGTKENPKYNTIWKAGEGVAKEDGLVQLLGGEEKAKQLLSEKGIEMTGNETAGELGALLYANFSEGDILNIDYSQFQLDQDWQAVYDSYTANEAFFNNYTWIAGNKNSLTKANLGQEVTTKLEYYSLLFSDLTEMLPLDGSGYENDPLGYLQSVTSVFSYPDWGSVRVHNDMIDGLKQAFDATIAEGGTIPVSSGGLTIRFMSNDSDKLNISNHATGRAIDFDAANNQQYFISRNSVNNVRFSQFLLEHEIGQQKNVAGWRANQVMAELFNSYRGIILQNKANVDMKLSHFFNKPETPYVKELKKLSEYFADVLKEIPPLSFNLDKNFTKNMRKYFNWGGDWWPQKDYMHFEAR